MASKRKVAIKRFFNSSKLKRDDWLKKARIFHKEDMNFLKEIIPEGSNILELGCGNGHLLASLKPKYGLGIDFSKRLISEAKKNHPKISFLEEDIENISSKDIVKRKFDFVIICDTIGFLEDVEETLQKLHTFFDENTRLIVSYYSPLWMPLLNIAEKKLLPQGDVEILINNDKEKSPTVKPGSSLLAALASQNIFIPSACGGGGTCSQCKCQVLDGGGEILPTEISHFSRSEVQDNYRLACQVKVKNDMQVKIPDEIFSIKKWECKVRSNYNVATFIKELVLELPEGEILDFQSGGYIQIDVPKYEFKYEPL